MRTNPSCLLLLPLLTAVACGTTTGGNDPPADQPTAFSLRFVATAGGAVVGCTSNLTGFGPSQTHTVGINDLRFYISNLQFKDASGTALQVTLDQNEFQHVSPQGSVSLVDLTGNAEGSCAPTSVAYAEGTARTHAAITGTTFTNRVASVSFDVGVPQGLMKSVIATNTPEGAPSPLNEMYWNWNSGYRHFVFNFSVQGPNATTGAGYLHLGSTDCAPMDGLALADRDACTFINTPSVALGTFDLAADSVGIDLGVAVQGLDFVSPIYDSVTFEVIGTGPGVECHSSPMQDDCPIIFSQFGLNVTTGSASAATNAVFRKFR